MLSSDSPPSQFESSLFFENQDFLSIFYTVTSQVLIAFQQCRTKGVPFGRLPRAQNSTGRHFQKQKSDLFWSFFQDSIIYCKAQQDVKWMSRLLIVKRRLCNCQGLEAPVSNACFFRSIMFSCISIVWLCDYYNIGRLGASSRKFASGELLTTYVPEFQTSPNKIHSVWSIGYFARSMRLKIK